jgi:hypothetical protein
MSGKAPFLCYVWQSPISVLCLAKPHFPRGYDIKSDSRDFMSVDSGDFMSLDSGDFMSLDSGDFMSLDSGDFVTRQCRFCHYTVEILCH